MSVNRTPETIAQVRDCVDDFEHNIAHGLRSCRAQWDIEGHTEPLTLYANRSGTFIVEPGQKPVPAKDWLGS